MNAPVILLINGPNLNLLGARKPEIYGSKTLAEIVKDVQRQGKKLDLDVVDFQSNFEGAIIDFIHAQRHIGSGIVINAGAYTHTSIAIRDALEAVELPVVEVHISDIHTRETFRHHSYISDIAEKCIVGEGVKGYVMALEFISDLIQG